MRFARAKCILGLLQQRGPVTSQLRLVRRKHMSGAWFYALAIDGGESVPAEVYHARGETAILEDPSANRLWIRIDQELRPSWTGNGSSFLVKVPSGMESESRPRGDAEPRGGDNPQKQCACRLAWPIDDHAGARARQRCKFHQVLGNLAAAIRDDPHISGKFDADGGRCILSMGVHRHACQHECADQTEAVASGDRCRCEIVHIGPAPTRRFCSRSALAGCAQIIGEAGPDIRCEQLIDAHPALRELLLIEVRHESIQRRQAAFD
jgi:hypothetical protein